jgi:hypothetical protein
MNCRALLAGDGTICNAATFSPLLRSFISQIRADEGSVIAETRKACMRHLHSRSTQRFSEAHPIVSNCRGVLYPDELRWPCRSGGLGDRHPATGSPQPQELDRVQCLCADAMATHPSDPATSSRRRNPAGSVADFGELKRDRRRWERWRTRDAPAGSAGNGSPGPASGSGSTTSIALETSLAASDQILLLPMNTRSLC